MKAAPSKRSTVVKSCTSPRRSFVAWCSGTPRKIVAASAWWSGSASSGPRRRLDAGQERRHHAAESARAGRQQDAPAERVDRCAAGERRAVELPVHQGDLAQVGGDGEHDRDRLDVVEQVVGGVRHVVRLDVVDRVVRRDAGAARAT